MGVSNEPGHLEYLECNLSIYSTMTGVVVSFSTVANFFG